MRRLLKPLWVLLALVFLFEAWLWEHLRPIVAWVVERIAWEKLKARLGAAIEHLPPYATLLVFLVPVVLLFPLKLAGLWMLAHGSWLGAMVILALAKVVSMGVPIKARIRAFAARAYAPVKRRVRRWLWLMRPGRPSRFLRRLGRLRRRAYTQPAE